MADQHMQLFQNLIDAVLTTPGDTPSSFRTMLAQHVAQVASDPVSQEAGIIPPDLDVYVRKVALHAYRVVDQDIEYLLRSGYSEDAIFEITLSVALGSAMNCLTQGLAAVDGARHALEEH